MEVLLCLAQSAGDLVTREELLGTVWSTGHGVVQASAANPVGGWLLIQVADATFVVAEISVYAHDL
jgi:hypothetical protein